MKIVLIGKSCSGKTQFSLLLKEKGLRIATTCTSRPMRPGEIHGIHYYFLPKDQFINDIHTGQFVEYDEFNSWYYGLPKSEYEKSDVIIVTPRGLGALIETFGRENLLVVYLDTETAVRLDRAAKRGDDPKEVLRRYGTDEKDFRDFIFRQDWDIRIDQKRENSFQFFIELFSKHQELKSQILI
jgi:guanylate kinase